MAGRAAKTAEKDWIAVAKRTLIDEGIGGLKIDRLAKQLGVTRSGFYRHFKDRDDFLDLFIQHWEATCRFLPENIFPIKPGAAMASIEQVITHLGNSDAYEYRFDLAVRGWARADKRAGWAIERADRERLEALQKLFGSISYDEELARVRAEVFYYAQIGSFTIGGRQSIAGRREIMKRCIIILCEGEEPLLPIREQNLNSSAPIP
ncbi:TetR/AcrR family transcriptional regulator [Sphingopyxis fribergensis]